jgi:pilus assembly protein CpaE
MSEEERSYTSVLLPGATIELFSRDSDTVKTFQSLAEDWRFARVHLVTTEGDVDTAIQKYGSEVSPDLVIIQTETIDNGFTDCLEGLAANCSEGTAAMIIGPDNDVNLYRKLVSMGVSDYLVKPLNPEQLSEHIARALIEKIGATDSALIAMIGAKGGVGTSALAQALAWSVSEHLNQKTFLLDAAGGWSTLPVGMDYEPIATLAEAGKSAEEQNTESLDRMFIKKSEKLTLLGSGSDSMLEDTVDPDNYEALLNHLMVTYPVVIADLSQSPAALRRVVLSRAHKMLVVVSPLLTAVRSARSLIQEIKDLRGSSGKNIEIVMNMRGISPKYEVSKKQMEDGLECTLETAIDFDPNLFIGTESHGTKITDDKVSEKVLAPLLYSVRDILQISPHKDEAESSSGKKSAGLGGLLNKLTSKS